MKYKVIQERQDEQDYFRRRMGEIETEQNEREERHSAQQSPQPAVQNHQSPIHRAPLPSDDTIEEMIRRADEAADRLMEMVSFYFI